MRARRIAVTGTWVLRGFTRGEPDLLAGGTVVVEDGRVAAVTDRAVSDAEHHVLPEDSLILPGFIDAHCHTLNGPLFRGTTEDRPRSGTAGTLVYDFLMPVGDLAGELLSDEEARAVYTAGLLRILRGGTTTIVDMFRIGHPTFLDALGDVGLRAYAMPYVASQRILGVDAAGRPRTAPLDAAATLRRIAALHETYDEGPQGRLRVGFGPHCTDTCAPSLLADIARMAAEREALVTIHVAQSRPEVAYIRDRHATTPVGYLVEHGLSGPGVLAAHCAYASAEEIDLLADTGTAVASCPATFAHGGHPVDYRRFADAGVTTGIGTDGHSLRYLDDLRIAGIVSKVTSGREDRATAADLLRTATEGGAAALGRDDLGTLRPGARADLVALVLDDPGVRPVLDPLRTAVWHHGGARTELVMIGGEVLVADGRYVRLDQEAAERTASAAVRRLWRHAAARHGIGPFGGGHPVGATPSTGGGG